MYSIFTNSNFNRECNAVTNDLIKQKDHDSLCKLQARKIQILKKEVLQILTVNKEICQLASRAKLLKKDNY